MGQPLVSICIVTYNQVDFISEAIVSAVNQDYGNLEIIVADDGSTDGTVAVVLEHAARYPGLVVPLVSGPNIGIARNCNRALMASKGKYIAWLAGDDVFYQGKITKQVEWMEEDEARVLCGHNMEAFDSSTRKVLGIYGRKMPNREGRGAQDIIKYGVASFYQGSSLAVRRNAIPEYGFDERLPLAADWKFVIDCLAKGGQFGSIGGLYGGHRRHERNVTRTSLELIFAELIITIGLVEAQYPEYLRACKAARARTFYDIGLAYLARHDRTAARYYLAGSLRYSTIDVLWKYPLITLLNMLDDRSIDLLHKMKSYQESLRKRFA